MKHLKFALAALAMIAGVGVYASNQNTQDPQLTQGYVSANCPITGSIPCGDGDHLAAENVMQQTQLGGTATTPAGDFVSKN